MPERAFVVAAVVHLLGGIVAEAVYAKDEKHHAAENLQPKLIGRIGDEIHDEAHSVACYQRIDDVAYSCTNTCYKPIPTSFLEGALYTEHSHRTHRSRSKYADDGSLEHYA